ncbi:MAG: rhodanese-like domain-containing protein [Candidatus Methylomirabilales bacterium]|jgi:rhodanese-related sulfurtransferase
MVEFEEKEPFERIDVEQAKTLIDKGFKVIDVREPSEWDQGHIPNATHVPLNTLLAKAQELLAEDNLIFVCAEGVRSAVACEVAAAVGRTNLYNLEGGTVAWARMGNPLDR